MPTTSKQSHHRSGAKREGVGRPTTGAASYLTVYIDMMTEAPPPIPLVPIAIANLAPVGMSLSFSPPRTG